MVGRCVACLAITLTRIECYYFFPDFPAKIQGQGEVQLIQKFIGWWENAGKWRVATSPSQDAPEDGNLFTFSVNEDDAVLEMEVSRLSLF